MSATDDDNFLFLGAMRALIKCTPNGLEWLLARQSSLDDSKQLRAALILKQLGIDRE